MKLLCFTQCLEQNLALLSRRGIRQPYFWFWFFEFHLFYNWTISREFTRRDIHFNMYASKGRAGDLTKRVHLLFRWRHFFLKMRTMGSVSDVSLVRAYVLGWPLTWCHKIVHWNELTNQNYFSGFVHWWIMILKI